jgi:hypothetical protein
MSAGNMLSLRFVFAVLIVGMLAPFYHYLQRVLIRARELSMNSYLSLRTN